MLTRKLTTSVFQTKTPYLVVKCQTFRFSSSKFLFSEYVKPFLLKHVYLMPYLFHYSNCHRVLLWALQYRGFEGMKEQMIQRNEMLLQHWSYFLVDLSGDIGRYVYASGCTHLVFSTLQPIVSIWLRWICNYNHDGLLFIWWVTQMLKGIRQVDMLNLVRHYNNEGNQTMSFLPYTLKRLGT